MSAKRDHERILFEAFLEIDPEFSGEGLEVWGQPEDEKDFPDIIGKSLSGRSIGIEIGEWLNEDEMSAAKRKERSEAELLEVLGDQGANPTQHIKYVWLHPKAKGRIARADAPAFREQVFDFIMECDARWPNERYWRIGAPLNGEDFKHHTALYKYLDGMRLWPARDEGKWERNWITFPANAGFFNQETMLGPLRELVGEKIAHYGANSGYDDLTLLVVYNRACTYNSPAETPLHSYEDAVAELQRLFDENRGAFNRVLLYIAVNPGARVLKVW